MKARVLIFLVLLLTAVPSAARRLPRYPFIRSEKNVLQGESAQFERFCSKLDTLLLTGRGNVRVLHVGGSHVQGGTLSDRLRRHFLSLRYGIDGGRGLVFPFAVAGTNTPVSYSSSYIGNWESASCLKPGEEILGLTGMVAVARDTSARVTIDLAPRERQTLQQRYTFNRVDVLGDGTLEPFLLVNGRDTLHGAGGRFCLPHYTDWIQLCFGGKGQYALRGLYLDKSGGGFSLSEAGVNGASTQAWLRCDLWEQELRRVMPDLVIFSIGINDIQGADFDVRRFKANYRQLIAQVRRVAPQCAILMSGINDSWLRKRGENPHTEAAETAFHELAEECGGVFWDWYQVMGGCGSMEKWEEAGLAQADRIHFTPAGYKLIGDLLFDAIMDAYYLR